MAVPAEQARAALLRLCAGVTVAYCSYAICRVPLLPLLARDLGADPPLVGLVMAASTMTGVFLKLPAGALSDLFGRRRLLRASSLVFAALPFTYLAATTLPVLVFLRFVHGSATAIFSPVASASVADIAPAEKRGTWLSAYATAQGAAQAIGPLVAGYLIAAGHFNHAFLIAGGIGVIAALIVERWPQSPERICARARWPEFSQSVVEVASDRAVLLTSAAQAAQFVLHGTLNAFVPIYGHEVLGLTAVELGWVFGFQTATTLVMRPFIGAVSDRGAASDRIGRRAIIVVGLLVSASGVLLLASAATASGLIVAIATYASGAATTTAATGAHITDITPRERYGAAHGVFGTIYDVGDALGPLAAGLLVTAVGYSGMFRMMAFVAITTAAAFVLGSRASLRQS
jgi:MFS transporter, DHA1 family, multidrug resistance protein